ncbi:hypothetical protein EV644_11867 [Kribbella orskensis]|uniref:Uncharacterized protein n=1 Tax=Kribbella orskensis TaxID=2512216 RepID=A0ABY2BEC2_9ACTN|nr:hypothetical protein EV642_11967 [Kribbella sp. VKM Ac-2500]TCO15523.1 hypothetical protein EV644_11867 [Kribbella orskensis]
MPGGRSGASDRWRVRGGPAGDFLVAVARPPRGGHAAGSPDKATTPTCCSGTAVPNDRKRPLAPSTSTPTQTIEAQTGRSTSCRSVRHSPVLSNCRAPFRPKAPSTHPGDRPPLGLRASTVGTSPAQRNSRQHPDVPRPEAGLRAAGVLGGRGGQWMVLKVVAPAKPLAQSWLTRPLVGEQISGGERSVDYRSLLIWKWQALTCSAPGREITEGIHARTLGALHSAAG